MVHVLPFPFVPWIVLLTYLFGPECKVMVYGDDFELHPPKVVKVRFLLLCLAWFVPVLFLYVPVCTGFIDLNAERNGSF